MPRSFSPEFRLTAACSMWPPSDYRSEAIRVSTAGPLDWSRFLRVAKRHQVIGLVHEGLRRVQADVPSEIAEEIGAQTAMLVRENLSIARESLRLQRLFKDADLPVLLVKGAALAMLAFRDVGLRASKDIDLLVRYEALPAATDLLCRAGYSRFDPPPDISNAQLRMLMPLRKDVGFVNQATGLQIELHWRLFLNRYAMDDSSFWAASRVVPLSGNLGSGTLGLRTLGDEDLFAYLCMHGALHWWKRLKWLADINALLAAQPEGGVERLMRAAKARGAGRAAAQAVQLCRGLLGMSLPARLLAPRNTTAIQCWLEATALNAMTGGQGEHGPDAARFGTTRGSVSTFLLSPSWRYRLTELSVQLSNQSDIVAVPLPERLRGLYPILRVPLWVWRHARQRNQK